MARYGIFGYLLAPTWSLAVEEQFYLTLPCIVRLVSRKYLAYVFGAGILLAPILRMLCFQRWPHNTVAYHVLMPSRADALLLGVLGAMAIRDLRVNQWLRSHGRTLFAILLIFVIGFVLLTKYSVSHPFLVISAGYSWLALLYLCIILYAVTAAPKLDCWPSAPVSTALAWNDCLWRLSFPLFDRNFSLPRTLSFQTNAFAHLAESQRHGAYFGCDPRDLSALLGVF